MSSDLMATISVQRRALALRTTRQELLASNIANADTPRYRAVDLDFKSAMASSGVVAGTLKPTSSPLVQTSSAHLPGVPDWVGHSPPFLSERPIRQVGADGNSVDMDIERSAFAENAMRMEANLQFIAGTFKTMQHAIQGQ